VYFIVVSTFSVAVFSVALCSVLYGSSCLDQINDDDDHTVYNLVTLEQVGELRDLVCHLVVF